MYCALYAIYMKISSSKNRVFPSLLMNFLTLSQNLSQFALFLPPPHTPSILWEESAYFWGILSNISIPFPFRYLSSLPSLWQYLTFFSSCCRLQIPSIQNIGGWKRLDCWWLKDVPWNGSDKEHHNFTACLVQSWVIFSIGHLQYSWGRRTGLM